METQFIRIAGELGWDLDTQIAKLEAFVDAAGRWGEWQDHVRGRRLQGTALRDALLRFVAQSGYSGAFTRFMLAEIPPPPRAVKETTPQANVPVAHTPAAGRRGGFMGWLRRRGSPSAS